MKPLWQPGKVIEALSFLRVDFVGMADYVPIAGKCVNATINLPARLRMEARKDDQIHISAGTFGLAKYDIGQINDGQAGDMFMRALSAVDYPFAFGANVAVDCEFGAIGMSSSSSVAALYITALELACDLPYDPLKIARRTRDIEPHWYGRQDQLAVAFGGMNLWDMRNGTVENGRVTEFGEVYRHPIHRPLGKQATLEQCLLLYHSGIDEGSSDILKSVMAKDASDPSQAHIFYDMSDLANEAYEILSCPDGNDIEWLKPLGDCFSRVWTAHKRLHPSVTNPRIDDLLGAAYRAGALGGRVSGAGGRGVMTFICKPGERARIIAALDKVDSPYHAQSGKVYNRGNQIHFGGFTDQGAKAWYRN